ncbi:hypothetical protein [Halostella litorea]|uniref:hypothetical protein n=1 Tax=Halostella litorea TaxID=2528831 RepID=UPI0010923FD4|nr:hypothetical protein [Halostella litorea]
MSNDEPSGPTKSGYVVIASLLVALAVPLVGGWSYLPLSGLSLAVGVVALITGMHYSGDDDGEGKDEDRGRREKEVEAFEDGFA